MQKLRTWEFRFHIHAYTAIHENSISDVLASIVKQVMHNCMFRRINLSNCGCLQCQAIMRMKSSVILRHHI